MGCQYVSVMTGRRDAETLRSNACIDEAINTLSKFSLVGLLGSLDRFRDEFREKFGVRLNIPRINITPPEKRESREHIPEKIHQKVVLLCQPDIEVYRKISSSP